MDKGSRVECVDFPCADVAHDCYSVPELEVDRDRVSLVMIAEASPKELSNHFYSGGDSLFARTTVAALNSGGAEVGSVFDALDRGIYLTTAVKCGKVMYGLKASTIKTCSCILEKELELFAKAKVLMLMGDVAIKALNYIAKRSGEPRVIPAGSTYKIRGQPYYFRGKRVFPSYLQAGPSYFIEKSKRQMMAEDIRSALSLIG